MATDDGRLEIVDHLGGACRPRHGQNLQLARLFEPRGSIVVVPRVRFGRRDTKRRTDEDDPMRRQIDERVNLFAANCPY
jgi:hypothetical protein